MGRRTKYANELERRSARRESARRSYHKRKGEKVIDDEFNRLLAMNPDLYVSKKHLTDEQKSFINSLMNMPLDTKPITNIRTRHNDSIAKQQLGLASSRMLLHTFLHYQPRVIQQELLVSVH